MSVVSGPAISNIGILANGAEQVQLVIASGDDFGAAALSTLDYASRADAITANLTRGGGVNRIEGKATRTALSAAALRTAASTGTATVREIVYRTVPSGLGGLVSSVRLKAAARITYTFDTSDAASVLQDRDIRPELAAIAATVQTNIGAPVAWMLPTSVVVEDLGVASPSSGFGWQGENGVPAMAHQYDMGYSAAWVRSLVVPTSGITMHGVLPMHWTWS